MIVAFTGSGYADLIKVPSKSVGCHDNHFLFYYQGLSLPGPAGLAGEPGTCTCDVSRQDVTEMIETLKVQTVDLVVSEVHQQYQNILQKLNERIVQLEKAITRKLLFVSDQSRKK